MTGYTKVLLTSRSVRRNGIFLAAWTALCYVVFWIHLGSNNVLDKSYSRMEQASAAASANLGGPASPNALVTQASSPRIQPMPLVAIEPPRYACPFA